MMIREDSLPDSTLAYNVSDPILHLLNCASYPFVKKYNPAHAISKINATLALRAASN